MTKDLLSHFLRSIGLLVHISFAGILSAEMLEPGQVFPDFDAKDQHEVDYPMPTETQYVAVTFTMSSGKDANKYFSKKGKDFLPQNNAVFLSNIHGMPGVARVFAMPKMRKYPHRIMLADQEGLLDPFPQEKGKVTIFILDPKRKILDIQFWDPDSGTDPFKKS